MFLLVVAFFPIFGGIVYLIFWLSTAPIITANWEAEHSRDKWTVPLGGGFGRVFRIGSLPPMNASIQAFYSVVRPDSVGPWSLRVQLQLMFPRG